MPTHTAPADQGGYGLEPRLASVLASLSAADREVLLLVAWVELTYEEVAAALAIPPGTVASRLNRARRRIRAALRDPDDNRPTPPHHPPANAHDSLAPPHLQPPATATHPPANTQEGLRWTR
ncbi:RNA polymerase sigma factor [Phytohabitans sp. LJ34]|uniref:RNA polymerase sigma factor n=1 Tax=Phytohabitans sp. LJ34 TaxID=3452217 RepID=UPI003F8A1D2E